MTITTAAAMPYRRVYRNRLGRFLSIHSLRRVPPELYYARPLAGDRQLPPAGINPAGLEVGRVGHARVRLDADGPAVRGREQDRLAKVGRRPHLQMAGAVGLPERGPEEQPAGVFPDGTEVPVHRIKLRAADRARTIPIQLVGHGPALAGRQSVGQRPDRPGRGVQYVAADVRRRQPEVRVQADAERERPVARVADPHFDPEPVGPEPVDDRQQPAGGPQPGRVRGVSLDLEVAVDPRTGRV